ncbi:MAG: GAF domain-containing sensor histidine kinase [Deinococcales bacterium]|nr:GAF domain-containing sensor histidine kinase [Deinococcales bacterium]
MSRPAEATSAATARPIAGLEPPERPAAPQSSLYEQIRLARLWLPLAIVGVVLVFQLVVLPQLGPTPRVWLPVAFYSVLGPLATYLILNWIALEVRQRERAQTELAHLYDELQASHELLGAIHDVTARYAAAPDLETTMRVAARGVAEVTGARAVGLVVGPTEVGASHGVGMTPELEADALARDRAMVAAADDGMASAPVTLGSGARLTVLSHALSWGGRSEGSLHAYYDVAPDQRRREAFAILAAQFSAAAESTRARMRDLLTLMEVDRTVRAEGNLERMLVTILHEMMQRVAARAGGVFLSDEEQTLRMSASVGLPRGASPVAYKVGEGIVGRVAAQREPSVLQRLSAEERAGAGPLLKGAGSVLALPLLADDQLLGVTVLVHPDEEHFDRSTIPYLGLLASQVSLAVRNATAYLQSEELAITEERSRIAREIHDGVAQLLAFSALKLDLVERFLDKDLSKARLELEQAKSTVRETIREVRRSIFALRPVDLERYGFVETVRRYAADFGQQNEVRVSLEIGDVGELSVKSEGVLFRIFQEAMHNVAKHARAGLVEVRLGTDEHGMAYVSVRDDGAGFDPEAVGDRVTSAGGLGLKQMRERVEGRGGRLTIESAPGQGTTVCAAVPD